MGYDIKLALDAKAQLGETPIWHPEKGVLYWTDGFAGEFRVYDPETGKDKTYQVGDLIGSAIPCTDGRVLLLLDTGLALFDFADESVTHILDVEPGDDANRLNDGRCDARGRLWFSTVSKLFGTEAYQPEMTGALYMVDTDMTLYTKMIGIKQLNGIGWSADNTRMHVVDTYNFKLYRFGYDIETGGVSAPQTAVEIPESLGYADGMCVDADDNVWIAHWAGKVSKWNPESGELLETVEMPVPNITCPGFGGEGFDTLYITTSKFGISEQDLLTMPLGTSGGLFALKPGVKGRESYLFSPAD